MLNRQQFQVSQMRVVVSNLTLVQRKTSLNRSQPWERTAGRTVPTAAAAAPAVRFIGPLRRVESVSPTFPSSPGGCLPDDAGSNSSQALSSSRRNQFEFAL